MEKVKILNYIIFDLHKFTRNNTDFYSPQNSYINQVLETRKGNPISLSIIYLAVAWKLGLAHLWGKSAEEFHSGIQG